ncbi:MAG: MarR family transcriptional regulator [Nitrospirae bacterium]|nr:MarR family transcriptional regulator [Nitrospirota bacterium]MCL5238464.1 MarR family transcriptional regulator [Nitrospirota bacterium]
MKVKKIKIGIRSVKDVFSDVKDTVNKIEAGQRLKPVTEPEMYFTSLEAFRKVLTPKRLELLHIIKTEHPSSVNELARMAKRDIKNVTADVKYLEQIGLIEKKATGHKIKPVINYDKIALEIAV